MNKILFNFRKLMGYYVMIEIPGDMNTNPQSRAIKENFEQILIMWPKVFTDHAPKFSITYP